MRRKFRRFGWDGPLERDIEDWTRLYPGESCDLERILAYSHRQHHLRLSSSSHTYGHGSDSIVESREAIQRILISATRAPTPLLYREFASRLRPHDTVITFNYDTLLEQALDEIGKPYTLTPEWWLSRDLPKTGYEYVDVLKLHGSVDWYDRQYHDQARRSWSNDGFKVPDDDPIFGSSPAVQSESLARGATGSYGSHILGRVFRVLNHADHYPIRVERQSFAVPFNLPPAYDKILGNDSVADLWEGLFGIGDLTAMVIVGYSMPQYDGYAYEALGTLMVGHQRGGDITERGHRRVPIQLITKAESRSEATSALPFPLDEKTRVWHQGFSTEALDWIDWGDGG